MRPANTGSRNRSIAQSLPLDYAYRLEKYEKIAGKRAVGIENSLMRARHALPPGIQEVRMHQIVYASNAVEDFSDADLKKLLLGARMRNKGLGVSGMLVFHDGTFLQALEGEKQAVNEIFASILADKRHRDIFVLLRAGPRTTRFR